MEQTTTTDKACEQNENKGQERNMSTTRNSGGRSDWSLPSPWLFSRDLSRQGFSGSGMMNPFSMMRRMMEAMDAGFGEPALTPPVEVTTSDNQMVVRADLPGMKPEDVKVEVTDSAIVIQGERKYEQRHNEQGRYTTEVRYGSFYRTIPLPEGANADQIQAKFENGVLEVTAPMAAQQRARQIPISTSGQGVNAGGSR
jgi:HSP20 family protein